MVKVVLLENEYDLSFGNTRVNFYICQTDVSYSSEVCGFIRYNLLSEGFDTSY